MNLEKKFLIKQVKNFTLSFRAKHLAIYGVLKLFLKLKYWVRFNSILFTSIKDSIFRLKHIYKLKLKKYYFNLTKEFLSDPNFLFLVYLQMKNKSTSIKILLNKKIFECLNIEWFLNVAKKIYNNRYIFESTSILSLNMSMWSNVKNKIIQQAIYILLNQIYECEEVFFFKISHGFRSGYSVHTALKYIKMHWTGLSWFIKPSIKQVFNKINYNILINLLAKKIQDKRFLDLLRKMVKCSILMLNSLFFKKKTKIWKNNMVFSFLCNIYLHEFDMFMINRIQKLYVVGKYPVKNIEYLKKFDLNKFERVLSSELQNKIKRSKRRELFNKGIKPYLHHKNYIRVKYIRCADEFLIGIYGPKFVVYKIKNEIKNWLKMNLHINIENSSPIYSIGNKIKFLGFCLYNVSFNQLPFQNSRRIEKFKRVKKKILAIKSVAIQKLSKRIRTNLTKIIKKKYKNKNNSLSIFTEELSETLSGFVDKTFLKGSYRTVLRALEKKIVFIVLNNTNKKIVKLLKNLTNFNSFYFAKKNLNFNTIKDVSVSNSKIKLLEIDSIQCFNYLLKKNGFAFCDFKKIKFFKSLNLYFVNKKIKLKYYPVSITLAANIKKKLKNKKNKSSLIYNYKILGDFFWVEQNILNLKSNLNVLNESFKPKVKSKFLKLNLGFQDLLPIHLKVNWEKVVCGLKIKSFLNKKGRPSSVNYLLTLNVSDLIKYFSNMFYKYIFYYKCVDNFNSVKSRFFWYFKFSLVTSIKVKFKSNSLSQVFNKYGKNIECFNRKGIKVCFVTWEKIKGVKKGFLDKI